MKIKVEQFCALATSPIWQAWLYDFDNKIYSSFIEQLQAARNCADNKKVMQNILKEIDNNSDKVELLFDFLRNRFPFVIEEDDKIKNDDEVFPGFVAGVLTYPHRIIIEAPPDAVENRVKKLLVGKSKFDYIIIGRFGYIEYLENHERAMIDKIPSKNWLINAYRNK